MAAERLSRRELIQRRLRGGFVGRRRELAVFADNLARHPDDPAYQFLFHVHGNAGVGKSSLVRQWEAAAREGGAVTALVGDEVHSPVEAMEAVGDRFARQGCPLKGFEKLLASYRQRRHEAETAVVPRAEGPGPAGPGPTTAGTVAAHAGLVAASLLPGVGALAGAVDPRQVAAGADRLREAVSARLRGHEDAELVLSPVRALTPKFVADLREVAERRPWVVLCFDTYERSGPLLDTWLRDLMVAETYGPVPVNVQAVLSGQGRLDARAWGDWLGLVAEVPLEVFTEEEARTLLASRGVTDERVVEVVLRLSGRLPVLLDTLAQARPEDPDAVGDPSGTAVERFLKWETDPRRREAALACALPLHVDDDVFRAAVPGPVAEGSDCRWLRGLPFVTDQAGRGRYHEVVRAAMLRVRRAQSPTRWTEDHTRLAEAFARWRAALEPTAPADGHTYFGGDASSGRRSTSGMHASSGGHWSSSGLWEDAAWREHRLCETYHRLCAHPRRALPAALRELLDAYGHGPATLERWIRNLAQAAEDSGSADLADWARRLSAATEDGDGTFLTLLLTRADLDPPGRAQAHTLRGRDHHWADRYDEALADYAAALALDPDHQRAYYARGLTYSFTGRHEEALADLDRAVRLDPDHASAVASRGWTYRDLRRYDEALADLDRALRLDPGYAWALASRAEVHRVRGRYAEALADFGRAVERRPTYAWADASRGRTYHDTRRYDEALADLDQALRLDPGYAWALASRAEVHRVRGRYAEALADFGRAVERRPTYAWAYASRGRTYQDTGRYDEALADLDRAITLEPDYVWALANRGRLRHLLGDDEAALADLDRALALNPGYTWAATCRAYVHDRLGRHEDALADFDRALERTPDSAWARAGRGWTLRALGRYDEARADYAHAVRLTPEDGRVYAGLAVIERLAGSGEEREHWERSVELLTAQGAADGPDAAVARGALLVVYCALPDWDRAADQLAAFLTAAPTPWQVREVLRALSDLERLLPVDQARLAPLLRRLAEALPDAARP
ncbi:tetratricopeptide repeat protein [Streptomyces sp. B1866]|uniref:tetratricopeptide repeat protein n=1 Tax=Streptomyces sp. B1866 TaxID=3075431 RepID=UPI00288CA83F|nr:tetratricopeptide repeat protein [Streptomyces sp. B1866]MDT3395406.1 tetratricopeptide repeat protein [Streptomyces sp. B1866]